MPPLRRADVCKAEAKGVYDSKGIGFRSRAAQRLQSRGEAMIKLAVLLGLFIAVLSGLALSIMGTWAIVNGNPDYLNVPLWVKAAGSVFAGMIGAVALVRPMFAKKAGRPQGGA